MCVRACACVCACICVPLSCVIPSLSEVVFAQTFRTTSLINLAHLRAALLVRVKAKVTVRNAVCEASSATAFGVFDCECDFGSHEWSCPKQFCTPLQVIMTCQILCNMLEAMPTSSASMVPCIPVLCSKVARLCVVLAQPPF